MSKDEYEVGYGKPPKSGQFKAGQSGNPKGRPKGRKSMATIIDDVFRKKVSLREGGKTKKVSQIDALIRRIVNDGLKGDPKATDQALRIFQIMSSLSEQASMNDDGTAPDLTADMKAIEEFLKLHDVTSESLTEEGDANG